MNNNATFGQGINTLSFIAAQNLDLEQVRTLHLYLPDLARAAKNGTLPNKENFCALVEGRAQIKIIEHRIDMYADPFLPAGWKVEDHDMGCHLAELERKGSDLYIKYVNKIWFYSSEKQKSGHIKGSDLRHELARVFVPNVNIGDYLLKHQYLIPKKWRKDQYGSRRNILFWGTIYRSASDYLYVRFIYWNGRKWDWSSRELGQALKSNDVIASLGERCSSYPGVSHDTAMSQVLR